MNKLVTALVRGIDIRLAIACLVSLTLVGAAFASGTSTFNQTINAGTLAVDIVDNSYAPVGSPSITMGAVTYSFACQSGGSSASGTFGASGQNIYISNPGAANNGWHADLAGSATTAKWHATGGDYDFNDSNSSGCGDGADADAFKGQMTVDPSGETITAGQCPTCDNTTGLSKGSSTPYVEGTTNSVTLLTSDGSQDAGDWKVTGVSIKQTIPAGQTADSYSINMVLSVTAT